MLYYLIIINLITFIVYGVDKEKSKKHKYRISEKILIFLSFFWGFLGAFFGMIFFHHKTKKVKFIILIPLSMLLWGFIFYKMLF